MKKKYFSIFFVASLLLFTSSCNLNEEEVIVENDKTAIEPDFFENDGSLDPNITEEEAPINASLKHSFDYTLLKPSGLKQKDVNEIKCGETKIMPLRVGNKKKKVGIIKVSNDGENLYVTVKAKQYKYIKKLYMYIGDKNDIPFYSNGYPNLRKFNYKAFPYYFGGQKKATYVIPLSSIDSDCFEIVAYAKIFDYEKWRYYSAFAYHSDLNQEYYYSYRYGYYFKDWVRSFDFCLNDCGDDPVDEDCLGSFAYNNAKPEKAFCFLDEGHTNWGWTNGKIFGIHTLQLYAKVEGCDWSSGEYVGHVKINYNPDLNRGKIQFITTDTEYKLKETYLYIGGEKYPLNDDGEATTDPNEFPYVHKNLGDDMVEIGIEIDNHFIDNIPDDGFYVSAYAVVTKEEE